MGTSGRRSSAAAARQDVDLDLHGIVGIRLVGATAASLAAVCRETGAVEGALRRPPDVVLRFLDRLPLAPGSAAAPDGAGLTADGWSVVRHRGTAAALAFAGIGQGCCEVHCETGATSFPLLPELVNLLALQRDWAFVHGSAFVLEGTGILIAGPAHSGKTGMLLAFVEKGAEYVGDDCIFLRGDGREMWGTARDLEVRDWHLRNLPRLRSLLSPREWVLWQGTRWLERLAPGPHGEEAAETQGFLPRLSARLRRRPRARIAAAAGFGSRARNGVGRPEQVFFAPGESHPCFAIEPADASRVALQIQSASCWTRGRLWRAYQQYRLATAGAENPFLERAQALHREILRRAVRNSQTWELHHPYPFAFSDLYAALEPVLSTARTRGPLAVTVPADIAIASQA